jgi:DNA-binding LacI/PurR family transcriptional regulator
MVNPIKTGRQVHGFGYECINWVCTRQLRNHLSPIPKIIVTGCLSALKRGYNSLTSLHKWCDLRPSMKLSLHYSQPVSLHQQIVNQIRRQIHEGELKPGERLPSYSEIKAEYGIHSNTMEKVLAKLEQEGLIERRRGSGSFVSANALKAKQKLTGIIGLCGVGFEITNSAYWSQLLQGVREAAHRVDAQLMLLERESSVGWEKADGVLISDWSSHHYTLRHVPPHLPCVSVLNAIPGLASVVADDFEAGRCATEHLLSLGHQRIAYLHGAKRGVTALRFAGYEDALKNAGIKPNTRWTRSLESISGQPNFVQVGYHGMRAWLDDNWRKTGCTAIIAHNDEVALGVIKALHEAGINVPRDVSVIGFDGTEIGNYITPRLSTVKLPLEEIGAAAITTLLAQIKADEVIATQRVFPVELEAHESTAALEAKK